VAALPQCNPFFPQKFHKFQLDLRRPIYRQTAAKVTFGRDDLALPWENTDRAVALRAAAKL